jgi:hypothetical protein
MGCRGDDIDARGRIVRGIYGMSSIIKRHEGMHVWAGIPLWLAGRGDNDWDGMVLRMARTPETDGTCHP